MLNKRWKIREVEDDNSIKNLADSLNISEVLAKLLFLRNIKTFSQAKYFFRPSIESLHDPYLMHGSRPAWRTVGSSVRLRQELEFVGRHLLASEKAHAEAADELSAVRVAHAQLLRGAERSCEFGLPIEFWG